jgi:hypothetical protein
MEVSTIRVSGWVKGAPLLSDVNSWSHPLTRMVLTRWGEAAIYPNGWAELPAFKAGVKITR